MKRFVVNAFWDEEAQVWVADSADVPGLCTEAATVEQLSQKLEVMIPELLENLPSRVSVRLEAH
jgi:predicted RNase H-like HicB family nuclease